MEPDFVARCTPIAGGHQTRDRYLVIEYKGMFAGQASEVEKREYLENIWAPAVSRVPADEHDQAEWQAVWIEDINEASQKIANAVRR
ncbi:MAG: hypothetical protein OXB95_07265 [Rhodobacteraceae bacterium]|nr:hypothetical protein [Paracoccaceae bacterium]